MTRLAIGAVLEPIDLPALDGTRVRVPGSGRVHLQFRRLVVGPDGTLVAVHYDSQADDQWSVDELLELDRTH